MTQIKMLPARSMNQTAEYLRAHFHVVVDNDVTLDDIMVPGFWGHHTDALKRGQLVDIVRSDLTMDLQARVLEVGKGFATVRVLRYFEDAEVAEELAAGRAAIEAHNSDDAIDQTVPEEYKIGRTPRGANAGFFVVYKPTGVKIEQGIPLRGTAVQKALAHAKQTGLLPPAPPATAPTPELVE